MKCNSPIKIRHIAAFTLLFAVATSWTSAQDAGRYLPYIRPSGAVEARLPLPSLEVVEGNSDVLVEELKGIMILDHESQVIDPIKPFEGVKIHPAADLTMAT